MDRVSFNRDWKYAELGCEKKAVTLPHDASLVKGRDKKAQSGRSGAYFKSGIYEYEKTFYGDEIWKDKKLMLEFEGVYPTAEVFLNDKKIASCDYGYTRFYATLDNLKIGEENSLRVLVDDSKHPNSRWYAGAGIYRPVNLLISEKKHINANGVKVTTKSYDPAVIAVDVEVENVVTDASCMKGQSTLQDTVTVKVDIYDGQELIVSSEGLHSEIEIRNAKLWDDLEPNLYRYEVSLLSEGQLLDKETGKFGIRLIEYSNKGFFINGRSVLLKGGCIHSDNGILGAASFAESEWRRIKKLKDFGYNAIRSSHNPLCVEALKACDALGMYVMDETWDTWNKCKNPYDFGNGFLARYESDIVSMIDKDYNHPSVVMYSIGNELTEPAKKEGIKLGQQLIDCVKKYDSSRPVTAGINLTLLLLAKLPGDIMGAASKKADEDADENQKKREKGEKVKNEMSSDKYNEMVMNQGNSMTKVAATPIADWVSGKILDKLDIAGYNYAVSRYALEAKKHPKRVVVGTETYCQDINTTWPLVEKYPYIIGDFMWTAWDYLGEVGIGSFNYDSDNLGFDKNYPWILSESGAFDILGNDTAEAGLAATVWGAFDKPYIGVSPANHPGVTPAKAIWRGTNALPAWSYKNCEGNPVTVEVYSQAAEIELYIDDEKIARKKLEDYKCVFETYYKSGELKAVAFDNEGNRLGESILKSATGDIHVDVVKEEKMTKDDIIYFDITLRGENNEIELNADRKLNVSVTGGELLAFGSANPATEENYLGTEFTTYYGRALAVVRRTSDDVRLNVSGDGSI